jgi:probable FeS assembly SUF system protein SufT
MHTHCDKPIPLQRDVEASLVPHGIKVTLRAGQVACITQALGGSYTVVVDGNMFRIEGKDADALGCEPAARPAAKADRPPSREQMEKLIWDTLRTCYDPEIPINLVDLGLIYDCVVAEPSAGGGYAVEVKLTLTAPGCGMGPVIQDDVRAKLLALDHVAEVKVELVWDPPWSKDMISEAAKLELGLL